MTSASDSMPDSRAQRELEFHQDIINGISDPLLAISRLTHEASVKALDLHRKYVGLRLVAQRVGRFRRIVSLPAAHRPDELAAATAGLLSALIELDRLSGVWDE